MLDTEKQAKLAKRLQELREFTHYPNDVDDGSYCRVVALVETLINELTTLPPTFNMNIV